MGEWPEYFEDFPEENPANWVGGRFDPKAAQKARNHGAKLATEQSALNSTIGKLIADGKAREKAKSVAQSSFRGLPNISFKADGFAAA
jgi:hypothetical protein